MLVARDIPRQNANFEVKERKNFVDEKMYIMMYVPIKALRRWIIHLSLLF
jgi:hypothetical protein